MNERIREIVRQTGYTWHVTGNPEMVAYYEFAPEKLEEFAELIVKECIDQVEVFNVRMDARPRDIVEAIQQHFGITR